LQKKGHEVNEYPALVESKLRPCGFEAIQLGVQSANSGTLLLMKTYTVCCRNNSPSTP